MSLQSLSADEKQRFTATGRPYKDNSQENSYATGMNSIMGADTFGVGNGAANLLPFRYTDESTLMIPVLKNPGAASYGSLLGEEEKKKSSKFSLRRKSKSADKEDFDMKSVTRGEYLKSYAKDEEGRYCGSEAPAEDCILRHPEDVKLYRSGI